MRFPNRILIGESEFAIPGSTRLDLNLRLPLFADKKKNEQKNRNSTCH